MVIKYVPVYYFMVPPGALNFPLDSRRFCRKAHSGRLEFLIQWQFSRFNMSMLCCSYRAKGEDLTISNQ